MSVVFNLKIAANNQALPLFNVTREIVALAATDFTDVAAIVLTELDLTSQLIDKIQHLGFAVPVFLLAQIEHHNIIPPELRAVISAILPAEPSSAEANSSIIESAAANYQDKILPPFFKMLQEYVLEEHAKLACPGHQGGAFYLRHPAGRRLVEFFGENVFRADLCNADVALGDLLIHQGAALEAQKYAAKVFNADKSYFVLNGTSASNKIVLNALLAKDDLVLFDRNNHKSVHHGALLLSGALPIYLETARNPYGLIGGIDAHCFEEDYLRQLIWREAPERAELARPFRVAVIQLGTYDGTIYNARKVIEKIGHLCEYILFDSAWLGYEQFIPMLRDCSPLLLELNEYSPGIFVTQSVHKQQAGFSQTSQILKKDAHLRGQARYCDHKHLNNAYLMHSSTSPFYPFFAALEVNAKLHDGGNGEKLWSECVHLGIETRKLILQKCSLIKPFLPQQIEGKNWQDYPTAEIANNAKFFKFNPNEDWHAFTGYAAEQYLVDPCKLLLTTPAINAHGGYEDFGIPASILAEFLRDRHIVPEKCDLNSILFLLTPAINLTKMEQLVIQLAKFEQLVQFDAPLGEVLPRLMAEYPRRYQGYTIRQLCQEMHNTYKQHSIKQILKDMFRFDHMPNNGITAQQAHEEFIRGNIELLPVRELDGRIAAEGALPYPPGVYCILPGEIWGNAVYDYFLAIEDLVNKFPGFAPELQGVYLEEEAEGKIVLYAHVLKQAIQDRYLA